MINHKAIRQFAWSRLTRLERRLKLSESTADEASLADCHQQHQRRQSNNHTAKQHGFDISDVHADNLEVRHAPPNCASDSQKHGGIQL
ncbi:uncharacterized [Tachysurus ichikawai]